MNPMIGGRSAHFFYYFFLNKDFDSWLNGTTMDISDAIRHYDFYGQGDTYSAERVKSFLKTDWITTIDQEKGACFTFDLNHLNMTPVPVSKKLFGRDQLAYLHVILKYDKLTSDSSYWIRVHDSIHDRFDALKEFPLEIQLSATEHRTIRLQKMNIFSISTEDNPCNADVNYGYDRCSHLQAGQAILQIYECRLPWMNAVDFGQDFGFCKNKSIIDQALKEFESIAASPKDCTRGFFL